MKIHHNGKKAVSIRLGDEKNALPLSQLWHTRSLVKSNTYIMNTSEILLYQNKDGHIKIDLRLEDEAA